MRLLGSFAASLAIVALVGCKDDSTAPSLASGNAQVRYVNVTGDTASLDFIHGPTTTTVAFGATSSATPTYVTVPWASQLAIRVTGTTSNFFSGVAGLGVDGKFTIISFGNVIVNPLLPGPAPIYGFVALPDTAGSRADSSLVRVYNGVDYLTNASDAVDVYIYPTGSARPATPDVIGLGRLTRTAYRPEAQGNLTVEVYLANAVPATSTPLATGSITGTGAVVRTVVFGDPRPFPAAPFPGQARAVDPLSATAWLPQCGVPAGIVATGRTTAAPPADCGRLIILADK